VLGNLGLALLMFSNDDSHLIVICSTKHLDTDSKRVSLEQL